MRHKTQKTLPLFHQFPNHPISQELQKISEILDELPEILDLVLADLSDNPRQGAGGLSAEFVLRAALIKQMFGYSYAELAFQLADSNSLRAFVRAPLEGLPKQSTLQRNIARIRDTTWQQIRCRVTQYAQEEGWEKGRQIRLDSTAVSTDIHHPSDSALLDDGVRTLTRLMGQLKERQQALHQLGEAFVEIRYRDHTRRARKLSCRIANGRGQAREKAYRELLKVARQTVSYAGRVLEEAEVVQDAESRVGLASLQHFRELVLRVIDQTERRVIRGEPVPAERKVVSLFEEHTNIIKKGQREPTFGHKIFVTVGRSSLILNCVVEEGNPADSSCFESLLQTHQQQYGRPPRQVAVDRGFYSADNLKWAKGEGIRDVAFERPGKLKITEMVRSSWVYRKLKRFRAGIEGCISTLKRVFGLRRCVWKGWDHFRQYVQASVVSYNLLVLARMQMR